MILAAGMGSRFGGLKQVEPIGPSGELIIDYSVYDAFQSGFDRLVVVIRKENEGDFRRAIGDRLSRRMPIEYAYQKPDRLPARFSVPPNRGRPWGTGHAALAASSKVRGPFAVINSDDFYGRGSFEILAGFLDRVDPSGFDYALIGFPLDRTLSKAGSVSRGICAVDDDGLLKSVTEQARIENGPNGITGQDPEGRTYPLKGYEMVSMNMWGFTPTVFPKLEEKFGAFLEAGRGANDGEFYLPEAINDLITVGEATVRALPTDESWFGVTYREDLDGCRTAIHNRIEKSVYPERLWGG